jgi:hypothetical protein
VKLWGGCGFRVILQHGEAKWRLRLQGLDGIWAGGRSSPQRGLGGNGGSKSGAVSGSSVDGLDKWSTGEVGA